MVTIELFKKQATNSWKETSLSIEQERTHLASQKNEIENELLKYFVVAPNSGELQNVMTLNDNQFILSGLKVAEIIPNTSLIGICWVSPQEIGLIRHNMEGRFQIDAYNVNEWGYLTGKILEISSDTYIVNSQPFFRIKCQLDKDYLTLQNNIRGKIKKGMTLQGTFTVAERTLYQLLYDKLDNWLNPIR